MPEALAALAQAESEGWLTAAAAERVRRWLTDAHYAEHASLVAEHIMQGRWQELNDLFWTVIPFGTGGRRGRMYPIGTNAINDRTMGESAQGLASYVRSQHGPEALRCAVAYDTRHRSRRFAELCSEVMAANGFRVYFLDGYRSTPELSFAVRHLKCACGLMITASHNPPSDNAIKAYWSTGGQLLPPHDQGVIDEVMRVEQVPRVPFAQALTAGQVVLCQEEVDAAYIQAVCSLAQGSRRGLRVLYSPMHGVGASSVLKVLQAAGFDQVELFGPHAEPNGDFPNVPGHVANPENPATFDAIIEQAQATQADLVLSSDPDADRLGAAAPLAPGGAWRVLTGNQIGALLADYLLDKLRRAGRLTPRHYVVKTLVTTELVRRIADAYQVQTVGNLHVGFKWIGGAMDEYGPEYFVLGVEESHGYLAGSYARDKDAAVAALLLAELAAELKARGQTLHQKLDALLWQHGCHVERQMSLTMPGSEGMQRMRRLMERLRAEPPQQLAGLEVVEVRDYQQLQRRRPGQQPEALAAARGDMLVFDLAGGVSVAVRPSGTEPKVKFYLFGFQPAELLADLDDARSVITQRLIEVEQALAALAKHVE
ncbi:MAG: phospho-sugar mutase [Pirellulales bacterium]|nr:phospho-sugar mutase [Pirellulales bacterium]